MAFVVHGATGAQGYPVVTALTAVGADVVALSRREAVRVLGARSIRADARSRKQLEGAYATCDGVFIHLPQGDDEELCAMADSIVAALGTVRPPRVVLSTSGAIVDESDHPLAAASVKSLFVV